MEVALLQARDEDSAYHKVMLEIVLRLSMEDVARCRAVSRSFCRLLNDDRFLQKIPITFSGFIFMHAPTGNLRYFSIASGRTSTVSGDTKYLTIFSTHDGLLLSTACGLRLTVANPISGMVLTLPWLFPCNESVFCAIPHRAPGSASDCTVFFFTNRGSAGLWLVTFRTGTSDGLAGGCLQRLRLHVDEAPYFPDVGSVMGARHGVSGTVARQGVYIGRGYLCVLFAEKETVWIVNSQSGTNWVSVLMRPDDSPDGEFALCRRSAGLVYLTCASAKSLALWKVKCELRPWIKLDHRVVWNLDSAGFPRVQVLHVESSSMLLVRVGRRSVMAYNAESMTVLREIEIQGMAEEGGEKWLPLFAFSPCIY